MEILFELDKTKEVVLHKMNIMTVKEFAAILHRDRGSKGDSQGRLKKTASSEFSYIYHLVDYKSPFNVYGEDEKIEQCKKNAGFPETWKPDEVVLAAIEKYKELQKTKSLRLLEAVSNSLNKAQKYFRSTTMCDSCFATFRVIEVCICFLRGYELYFCSIHF